MTKQEAQQLAGSHNGQLVGEAVCTESNLHIEEHEAKLMAHAYACDNPGRPMRLELRNAFDGAFINSFMKVWRQRRAELPEVKAEALTRYITRRLNNLEEQAKSALASFNERLNNGEWDAAYRAFDWGQDALTASATLKAVANCKEWFKGGVEPLKAELMVVVLNGAKYPKQSTSQMSNLLEQALLATYAEVLDMLVRS